MTKFKVLNFNFKKNHTMDKNVFIIFQTKFKDKPELEVQYVYYQ